MQGIQIVGEILHSQKSCDKSAKKLKEMGQIQYQFIHRIHSN